MDMIVNLYALNKSRPLKDGIAVKRLIPHEAAAALSFVKSTFPEGDWSSEIQGALWGPRPRLFIAVKDRRIIGFAAYDVTAKGFFGPFGVEEGFRRQGVGEALARAVFLAMKEDGYAYAIIGWVGPKEWYEKTFGAKALDNSLEESVYSRSIKL